jgi:hypothetical protein
MRLPCRHTGAGRRIRRLVEEPLVIPSTIRSVLRNSTLAVAGLALAFQAEAGLTYKAKAETSTDRGKPIQSVVEAKVEGSKARIEFRQSNNPLTGTGSVMVTEDAGETLYLLNTKDKTYAELDLEALTQMVGGLAGGGGMLKMEIKNPKVETLLDQPGEPIQGVPTRHLRFKTSYTMTVKVFGMGSTSAVEEVQDVWSTTALADLGLRVWLQRDPPSFNHPDFDRLIQAEMKKIQGFPLKMETVNTSTDKKSGEVTTTRTTMEVTELKTNVLGFADSEFKVPAGYKEQPLFPTAEGNPFAGLGKPRG